VLDLRGEVCPYTFLKARLALEDMRSGAVLRVVVDSPTSARDVPRSLEQLGHRVLVPLAAEPVAGSWTIVVRRR
jgi:tRNA 2-thiouridine synthesizing protein A